MIRADMKITLGQTSAKGILFDQNRKTGDVVQDDRMMRRVRDEANNLGPIGRTNDVADLQGFDWTFASWRTDEGAAKKAGRR